MSPADPPPPTAPDTPAHPDAAGRPDAAEQPATAEHADVAGLGYEAARDELVEVVRALEGGGVTLEQSLALWERGEALAGRCQSLLEGARARLDAVREDRPAT